MLIGILSFLLYTSRQIMRESEVDEARPADAIVVFGAAEYVGRPSPVYRARLDHAYELFERGMAPVIITTGGAGKDPHFSEGQVGRDYLEASRRSGREPDRRDPGRQHRPIRRSASP